MPIDKATALAQIDAVLQNPSATEEAITIAAAALRRLSPPGSVYLERMEEGLKLRYAGLAGVGGRSRVIIDALHGTLKGLRADYAADRLRTFQELVHADLFSDFLEMAEYFLEEGYKDPAAVIAGGVLEEHLRKLCGKHGIVLPAKPKLDTVNADLARASVYGKNDQKQVTAWAGLRNDAAHGQYGNYTIDQVKLMASGIRAFIGRNPA